MTNDSNTDAAAEAVLVRLHDLALELEPLERTVLGRLLAPGISRLFEQDAEGSGSGLVRWTDDALPRAITAAVHRHGLDLVVDDLDPP